MTTPERFFYLGLRYCYFTLYINVPFCPYVYVYIVKEVYSYG